MKRREIIDVGATIAAVIIIYLFLTQGLPLVLGTEKPLAVVPSHSMEPTFHVGDLLIISGVKPQNIKVGDIIVYNSTRSGQLIVHRVIAIKVVKGRFKFLTKGDANALPDADPSNPSTWVDEKYVIGKVVFVVPYLGIFKLIFEATKGNPAVGYSLLAIIIFALVVSIIYSIIPKRKR